MRIENIEVTDLNNQNISIYFNASEVELLRINEPNPGLFIAESPKVIGRAINAGYEPVSFLICEEELHEEGRELLNSLDMDIVIYKIAPDILRSIRGFNLTNGMMCAMKRKKLALLETLCEGKKRIAVFDDVENPTNVGAIFRSAAALNIDAVILAKGSSDPLYRRSARVSMGTVFQIPWTYTDNEDYIDELKRIGFETVAMALMPDSLNIDDPILKKEKKLAIILGNEGNGLPKSRIEACTYRVMIPMGHGVDSLNVSTAAALAFWELGNKDI